MKNELKWIFLKIYSSSLSDLNCVSFCELDILYCDVGIGSNFKKKCICLKENYNLWINCIYYLNFI